MAEVKRWNRLRSACTNSNWTGSNTVPIELGHADPRGNGSFSVLRSLAWPRMDTYVVYNPEETISLPFNWWVDINLGVQLWLREEALESAPEWSAEDDPRTLGTTMLYPTLSPIVFQATNIDAYQYTVSWKSIEGPIDSHGQRSIPIPLPGLAVVASLYYQSYSEEEINWLDPEARAFTMQGMVDMAVLWGSSS